jgi:hypothetical protein
MFPNWVWVSFHGFPFVLPFVNVEFPNVLLVWFHWLPVYGLLPFTVVIFPKRETVY